MEDSVQQFQDDIAYVILAKLSIEALVNGLRDPDIKRCSTKQSEFIQRVLEHHKAKYVYGNIPTIRRIAISMGIGSRHHKIEGKMKPIRRLRDTYE